MHFKYTARNSEGEQIKGEIEAADETLASSALREKGLYISSMKKVSESKLPEIPFLNKTSLKDKIIFTQQLGIMIKSGLNVVDALKALSTETTNQNFTDEITDIISDVKGGAPLSDAFAKHPRTFDPVYISTVRSGEKSGKLDEVLKRLAIQLDKDYELSSKLRSAMFYPAFVLTALVIVMVLVMIVIVPQLTAIFEDVGVPLPILTRIVITLSKFMQSYILYIVIALIGIYALSVYYGRTTSGRHLYDTLKLKVPVFGKLLKKSYMAKFTRTFAGLSAAGLPLLDIFKAAKEVINNSVYQEEIAKMEKKIEVGESISKVIKDCPLFPGMVGQLASVGEKSGSIDLVFDSMANFFDKEVDNITSNLSVLLEPILMVIMGIGVGLLIVSVLQPIYGLVNAL